MCVYAATEYELQKIFNRHCEIYDANEINERKLRTAQYMLTKSEFQQYSAICAEILRMVCFPEIDTCAFREYINSVENIVGTIANRAFEIILRCTFDASEKSKSVAFYDFYGLNTIRHKPLSIEEFEKTEHLLTFFDDFLCRPFIASYSAQFASAIVIPPESKELSQNSIDTILVYLVTNCNLDELEFEYTNGVTGYISRDDTYMDPLEMKSKYERPGCLWRFPPFRYTVNTCERLRKRYTEVITKPRIFKLQLLLDELTSYIIN